MKKKYIFLILLLLILTGCFNKENESEKLEEVIDINNNEKELEIDNLEVKKVMSTSKNYAIVMDSKNDIYIINNNNIYEGIINNSNDSSIYQINDNGYVYQNIDGEDKIYDKTGKELLSSNQNQKYFFGISPDNLLIRKIKENDNYKYEVVDVFGKVIINDLKKVIKVDLNESISIVYLGGNIYVISTKENDYLYNIKYSKYKLVKDLNYELCSKKTTNKDNLEKCYELINNDMIRINNNKILIKEDLDTFQLSKYDIVLDKEYYYSEKDKSIKKYDGTKVKDMEMYQVNDILFKDNKYYLATNKGLMILDNKLNQVGDIQELGNAIKKITPYGIIVNKEKDKRTSAIYDFDYKLIKDLDNVYLYDNQDFITKAFIDLENNDLLPYNIKALDFIKIIKK